MEQEKNKCENCINSIEAFNKRVVGCRLLNFSKDMNSDEPQLLPFDVKGLVMEGWFKCGMGMIKGLVVFKNATCDNFEGREDETRKK
jgi:hypothetical protein